MNRLRLWLAERLLGEEYAIVPVSLLSFEVDALEPVGIYPDFVDLSDVSSDL